MTETESSSSSASEPETSDTFRPYAETEPPRSEDVEQQLFKGSGSSGEKKLKPIFSLRRKSLKVRLNIPSSMKELIVSNREKQSVKEKNSYAPRGDAESEMANAEPKNYQRKRNTLEFGLKTNANVESKRVPEEVKTDYLMSPTDSSDDRTTSSSSSTATESTWLEDSCDLEAVEVMQKERKYVRRRIRHKYSIKADGEPAEEKLKSLDKELESLSDHRERPISICYGEESTVESVEYSGP